MAEELYQQTPRNKELSVNHLSTLFLLPRTAETENLKRLITSSFPGTIFQYYWFRGWQLIRDRRFGPMFTRLRWSNIRPIAKGWFGK